VYLGELVTEDGSKEPVVIKRVRGSEASRG